MKGWYVYFLCEKCLKCLQLVNRDQYIFSRFMAPSWLGGKHGLNYSKCMGFWPTWNHYKPLQRDRFPWQKCIFKDICIEIIFMKYKKEIQVIRTVNKFLRFHTNPSNQYYANYDKIRRHMRRFIIRINQRCTFCNSLKVMANVGNPPSLQWCYSISKWAKMPYIHCNFSHVCPPAKMAS